MTHLPDPLSSAKRKMVGKELRKSPSSSSDVGVRVGPGQRGLSVPFASRVGPLNHEPALEH